VITNTPPTKQNDNRDGMFFDILDGLCGRYTGLSPIEVMNSDIKDVFELYVYVVLKGYKDASEPKKTDQGGAVWVTSKTATWH